MLLPFAAFSQTTLSIWKSTSGFAATSAANVNGGTLTANNVNLSNDTWNGFLTSNWSPNTTVDLTKYLQFTVAPASGYKLTLDKFKINHGLGYNNNDTNGPQKITVQYSVNADFSGAVTLISGAAVTSNLADLTLSFNNFEVAAGKTLYVRLYGYNNGNIYSSGGVYRLMHIDGNGNNGAGNAEGPAITGTVTAAGTTAPATPTTPPVPTTGPLNGTYAIGATAQATYPQFATLTAAVNYLNTNGISGAVTFLLTDTTYTNSTETYPLTINAIANSNATNTVTFKPAVGKNVSIEAININSYTGVPAVFKLNGADYVIFDGSNATNGTTRNLTLNNKDAISESSRAIVWIASNGNDGATHITVKNCVIKQAVKNSAGRYSVGIYSGKTGTDSSLNIDAATADNSDLTITNNKFTNVKQGIYVNGGTAVTSKLLINKNDIGAENNTETILCGATLSNVNSFDYLDNYIYNIYRDNNNTSLASSGISILGASTNGNILRNSMRDLTKATGDDKIFAGILLGSTSTSSNILVANNFILNVTGYGSGTILENGHGIAVTAGGGYKIYYNTVQLNTNQPNGGFSSALYVGASATGLDVRNNIFSNNQTNTATRRTAITILNTPANINTVFSNLDNNDYWSNDRIGYITAKYSDKADWAGNGVQGSYEDNSDYFYTLDAFRGATGKDAKTVSVLPIYVSAIDLHIDPNNAANAKLNDGGVAIAAVTKDIDGQVRNATTPDMGADEFGAIPAPTPGSTTGIYCASTTTWNGTGWNNGTPDASKDVIFNGPFTQNGGTFYACSIYVLNTANVNFVGNATAVVTHSVNVSSTASLTFESSSNLIQIEDDANSGTAVIKRNSSNLKRLDYTLWASPVYDSRTTGYQSLQSFSPETASTRFYTYNTIENTYSGIASPTTTKFEKGKSTLIRMPNVDSTPGYAEGTTRLIYTGAFQGTPNNGNIRLVLPYASATNNFSSIGNPYPSPLNVTEFINQNVDAIEGTLWLWRKTNDNSKSTYATLTLAGYVANSAPGGSSADGNTLVADPYSIATEGSLNTAQGFIVKAKAANKELVFNNSMRLQTHSQTFFRSAEQTEETAAKSNYDRVWFNVNNTSDDFTQTLVAYNASSTLGYDDGYDGASFLNGNVNFYSVLNTGTENVSLAIQARGKFNLTDAVPMGFKAVIAGTYTLSIDHTEGLLAANDTNILIVDKLTGVTKNLKDGSYTFTTEAGTFESRFKIVYASKSADGALGTDSPAVQAKQVIVYKNYKKVSVQAPSDISSVVVYDMLGKVLFQKNNIDGQTFSTSDINAAQQVIIVNVTLDNNAVISKKIIN